MVFLETGRAYAFTDLSEASPHFAVAVFPTGDSGVLAATSRDTVRSWRRAGTPSRRPRTAWPERWDAPEHPDLMPMPY